MSSKGWRWTLANVLTGAADAARSAAFGARNASVLAELVEHLRRQDALAAMTTLARLYKKENGEMLSLEVNSKARTVRVSVQAKDQNEPFSVSVARYDVQSRSDGKRILVVEGVTTSSSTANIALRTFGLNSKTLELPQQYAELIEQFL